MKASFVDLRKKSSQIIRALDRNEPVTLFYRGKPKAIMQSLAAMPGKVAMRVQDHPAFGLWAYREDMKDASVFVRRLRRGRFASRRGQR